MEDVRTNKTHPIFMRRALELADELKKTGVLFVPVPVLNNADGNALYRAVFRRLDLLAKQAEIDNKDG